LCRGMNEFKKGYWPRKNLVKSDRGNLVADSHSIVDNCKSHFCLLLNLCRVTDVRQHEIRTAGSVVPYLSAYEVMTAIENLKRIN
jgi:hypothetical protein